MRAELAARGRVHAFECVRRSASGAPRHLSLHIDPVTIGGVPHTLTTIEDIAAREEAKAAKQLAQRTQALDELKTRFFASISHELRTPLALILGPTEQLLQAPDTAAAARRDLAIVQRNARTLLGLVENLLDLAKLEAGRMTAAYAEADLAELARFVAGHFEGPVRGAADPVRDRGAPAAARAARSGAGPARPPEPPVQRLQVHAAGRPGPADAARGPGARASRSPTAAPGSPPTSARRRSSASGRWRRPRPAVTPGRASGSRSPASSCSSTAGRSRSPTRRRAARSSRSSCPAPRPRASPSGRRTRWSPAHAGGPPRRRSRAAHAPAERAAAAAGGRGVRALVLVVEDNPEMRRFIARSLAERYRVVTAADGAEGLARAAALLPDLILCDLMMPELDGEQMVLEVRRRPAARRDADRRPLREGGRRGCGCGCSARARRTT